MGNVAGFAAGFVTGWLKDLTSDYYVPMFVVSGIQALTTRPPCAETP